MIRYRSWSVMPQIGRIWGALFSSLMLHYLLFKVPNFFYQGVLTDGTIYPCGVVSVILYLPCRYMWLGFMLQAPSVLWQWVVLSAAMKFMKILFMSVYLCIVIGKAVHYLACFLLQNFCVPYLCCLWENLKFPTKFWLKNHKGKQ
jgi:hypothetical protein